MKGPRSLKALIAGWMPHAAVGRGAAEADHAGSAFAAAWEKAVGNDVARRSQPTKFRNGVLTVLTASSAWSDELSLHSPRIIEALQRAFPEARLQRLRFMVASGRTKVLLDSERSRATRGAKPRPTVPPQARPQSSAKEDLSAIIARLASRQKTLNEERDQAGWKICAECERRFSPDSSGPGVCAPCAQRRRAAVQASIERALMHAPWLSLADVRRISPRTTSAAYERTRQRLLTRWQSDIESAQRRLRRGQLTAEDRVVAWSYLMLMTGVTQRDIGRAVVMDVLGRDWMGVLFGDGVAQNEEARRSSREKHNR